MSSDDRLVNIQLLDRQFQLKCSPDQVEPLQQAAYYLDGKMREIRDSGKAVGNDRIVMMAALTMAFETMNSQRQKDLYLDTMSGRIKDLQKKIATALEPHPL